MLYCRRESLYCQSQYIALFEKRDIGSTNGGTRTGGSANGEDWERRTPVDVLSVRGDDGGSSVVLGVRGGNGGGHSVDRLYVSSSVGGRHASVVVLGVRVGGGGGASVVVVGVRGGVGGGSFYSVPRLSPSG